MAVLRRKRPAAPIALHSGLSAPALLPCNDCLLHFCADSALFCAPSPSEVAALLWIFLEPLVGIRAHLGLVCMMPLSLRGLHCLLVLLVVALDIRRVRCNLLRRALGPIGCGGSLEFIRVLRFHREHPRLPEQEEKDHHPHRRGLQHHPMKFPHVAQRIERSCNAGGDPSCLQGSSQGSREDVGSTPTVRTSFSQHLFRDA